MMMPSLSVVHTVPSRRRKLAPALSSPPKPYEPSSRPGTNHLKPTGTSARVRPSARAPQDAPPRAPRPPEAERAVEQARHEPLEADGDLREGAPERARDAVDQA